MRWAACALLTPLLLLGAIRSTRLCAEDEKDVTQPPVDLKDWEARDLEGRWVKYLSTAPKPGLFEKGWGPFLALRKEWDLLTWIALATDDYYALEALRKGNRASWMAVAWWISDSQGDGHRRGYVMDRMREDLGLTRSWIEIHRKTVGEHAVEWINRFTDGARDEVRAQALAPPLVPDEVLAALTPPAQVVPFGDRLRAEPGVTYLHQVERALDTLARSGLEGEPWKGRLAALLTHPVPDVRKAAALCCSRKSAETVPLETLLARIDAPDEVPEVRSAAVVALPVFNVLSARWKLMKVALDTRHPSFTAAASRLADVDDGFALEMWKTLDTEAGGKETFFHTQRGRLAARLAEALTYALDERKVPRMLALVSYVRKQGDPLQTRLQAWTLDTLTAARAEREVPEALEKAATTFEPADISPLYAGDMRLRDEVRAMAREILARPAPAPAGTPR